MKASGRTLFILARIAMILAPPILLIVSVLVAALFIVNRPVPEEVPAPVIIPRVRVVESAPTTDRAEVRTEGIVEPMWEAGLTAQVAGQVLAVSNSFQTGRQVRKGEVLVHIERTRYDAALAQAESGLETARQRLEEEKASSLQALREWERSGRRPEDAPHITLRKPQLAAAEAGVRAAESARDSARLDLDRVEVKAPFDGVIEDRGISPGDVVAPGQSLGRLIGTEMFEARLALSPRQAASLPLPMGPDSEPLPVTLSAGAVPGRQWPAVITRTDARIDSRNRLVITIAEVPDPLGDPENPLPAGAFVSVVIPGNPVSGVHVFPESAVVRDDFVWVVDGEDRLRAHTLDRLFSRDDRAVVRFREEPLAPRRVVLQTLPSYADGMKVEIHREAVGDDSSTLEFSQ